MVGSTPLEVAAIFGPHPEVEAVLGGAMLDRGFESRYLLRRGSLEMLGLGEADDRRRVSCEEVRALSSISGVRVLR